MRERAVCGTPARPRSDGREKPGATALRGKSEQRDATGEGKREKRGRKETERGITRQVRLVTSWMISAAACPDARARNRR